MLLSAEMALGVEGQMTTLVKIMQLTDARAVYSVNTLLADLMSHDSRFWVAILRLMMAATL